MSRISISTPRNIAAMTARWSSSSFSPPPPPVLSGGEREEDTTRSLNPTSSVCSFSSVTHAFRSGLSTRFARSSRNRSSALPRDDRVAVDVEQTSQLAELPRHGLPFFQVRVHRHVELWLLLKKSGADMEALEIADRRVLVVGGCACLGTVCGNGYGGERGRRCFCDRCPCLRHFTSMREGSDSRCVCIAIC